MRQTKFQRWAKMCMQNDYFFAALIAIIITALIFSPYVGQKLYSDVMTFQKGGDQLRLTYPAFVQAGQQLLKSGVDIGSFNGATEMALRANLPMYYFPMLLFALFGNITTFRMAYLLFFATQMAVFIYFGILTGMKFFSLNRKYACLCAISSLAPVFVSSWYVSFYIAATLFWPLFYASLSALNEKSLWRKAVLYSLPFVLGFLCGYTTLAVYLCALVFILTTVYDFVLRGSGNIIKSAFNSVVPVATAGVVILPYYFEILKYTKGIVMPPATSLSDAEWLTQYPIDVTSFISYAFPQLNPIETQYSAYIGWGWLFIALALAVCSKIKTDMAQGYKRFIKVVMIIALVQIATCVGSYLPVQSWFYAIVPILGVMHLPGRYLHILMPVVFLALTIIYSQIEEIDNRITKYAMLVVGVILAYLLAQRTFWDKIDVNVLILELLSLFVLLVMANRNIHSKGTIGALLVCTICMPLLYSFYTSDIQSTNGAIEMRSVVYSEPALQQLNNAIDELPEKDIYKFVAFDSIDDIPGYIPNNLAWYEDTNDALSNYIGFELQLCTPSDYLDRFPWFDRPNWEYVANTRGSFVILDSEIIESNPELYDTLIDDSFAPMPIGATNLLYKLKEFIPKHYTGESFVVDDGNAMDNGYFYCPSSANATLLNFDTNESTYFNATVSLDNATDLAFCFYPNRYYVYYVDDEKVEPIIDDMQAFIPLDAGEHTISIKYKNPIEPIVYGVFGAYALVLIVFAVKRLFNRKKVKK